MILVGVVVTGSCGSGKTSCVKVLAGGLTRYSAGQASVNPSKAAVVCKTHFINPLAVSTLSEVFGHIDSSGSWQEGIFTQLLKRAVKVCKL